MYCYLSYLLLVVSGSVLHIRLLYPLYMIRRILQYALHNFVHILSRRV